MPKTARIRLGADTDRPEFSRFAWFSMMFGAGIGVGMLTYSTAEPLAHFANNPDVILGATTALERDNLAAAYKWTLLHYGLTPWGCYAIVGMSLAYFAYRRNMPLTIRSPFTAVLSAESGRRVGGVVDAAAILATIIGIGVTIGYGVNQLAFGMHQITGWEWLVSGGRPSLTALFIRRCVFNFSGDAVCLVRDRARHPVALKSQYGAVLAVTGDLLHLWCDGFRRRDVCGRPARIPLQIGQMSITVWSSTDTPTARALSDWQSAWNIFYWAWWIAFTPFVGLFLARVSRGRTIGEYVVGRDSCTLSHVLRLVLHHRRYRLGPRAQWRR